MWTKPDRKERDFQIASALTLRLVPYVEPQYG